MRDSVSFSVNGEIVEFSGKAAFAPLSDTLRYRLRKTGTKVVCAEGDCGACTVMVARSGEEVEGKPLFRSLNACIFPTFLADGCHVVTVEGLERDGKLHPVQDAMIRHFGGQCGFCTPGFVLSIVNMYEHKADPTERNAKNYLTGNLCRCTGYQPILNAALDADPPLLRDLYPLVEATRELAPRRRETVLLASDQKEFFGPVTIEEAVDYRKRHPHCRIFSGATDIGVQTNKGRDPGSHLMALHLIEELDEITEQGGTISVGARVTLDRLETFLEKRIPKVARFLGIFASPQIKNAATLVGNLANGSPIADTTPFLLALGARVCLVGERGERTVPLNAFFRGYKDLDLESGEFISRIEFASPPKELALGIYKVSQRRDLDISCVNASFALAMKGSRVIDAKLAYGGVGPTPVRLGAAESLLKGNDVTPELVQSVGQAIAGEVRPLSDVRGTEEFRRKMSVRLWERFAREELPR